MNSIKKFVSVFLIILILVSGFPTAAFAQAEVTPSPASGVGGLLSGLTFDFSSNSPTPVKQLVNIRKLQKASYRATEDVTFTVDNADTSEVQTAVFNSDGEQVFADLEVIDSGDSTTVKASPPRSFKPGRYRLRINTTSGQESVQDFTWGVLAINTNKSIYLPDETAKLFLAVLDETGSMVCDADVTLTITDPKGEKLTMTTKDHNIKVNPACYLKEFTLEPDYETRYSVGGVGNYQMALTAITENGTYSIQDSFQVQESVPFDVQRSTVTRVFPPATYPVVFDITASQDFEGVVQEVLPDNFEVGKIPDIKGYDAEVTESAAVGQTSTESKSIPVLGLPYKGSYLMTQGFGGAHTDPYLLSKYLKYGVLGHDGLDFALPKETEVLAVSGGKVLIARENFDYGTTIIVEHAWGRSYYGHLSELKVKEGDIVKQGQVIGLSGNTGLSTGPHLHFGIKPNTNDAGNGYYGKINPQPYLTLIQEGTLNLNTINH